jgi:hypothetical protein
LGEEYEEKSQLRLIEVFILGINTIFVRGCSDNFVSDARLTNKVRVFLFILVREEEHLDDVEIA